MRTHPMRIKVVLAAAGTLIVSSCGAAAEELSERAIENAIESEGGDANVEFDADGGEITIENDEGSFTIGGGEVPDGLPMPIPTGGDVISSFTSNQDGVTSAQVGLEYPSDRYMELVELYDEWTEDQEDRTRTESSSGGTDSVAWSLSNEGRSIFINAVRQGDTATLNVAVGG